MQIYLMHEDNPVAVFDADDDSAKSMQIINTELLPYLPWVGPISKRALLKTWVKERCVPKTRDNYKRDTHGQPIDFALHNLGVSLTDHYWYKPMGFSYTWDDVNPLINEFETTLDLESVYKDTYKFKQKQFSPSLTLRGNIKKKWIIDKKGKRILIKGNILSTQQVYNELFACELCRCLGFENYVEYIKYHMQSYDQDIIGSACECMPDNETELIHAYEIIETKQQENISDYQYYISYCTEHGINTDELKYNIDMSIIVDFLLTNTDRHYTNFGILRNAKTFKFIKPAPLFDTGNSMFWNMPIPLNHHELFKLNIKGFCKHELKLLKLLSRRDYNLDRLPAPSDVYDFYKALIPDTASKIAAWYKYKMDYLKNNIITLPHINHYGITPIIAKHYKINYNDELACKVLSDKIAKDK